MSPVMGIRGMTLMHVACLPAVGPRWLPHNCDIHHVVHQLGTWFTPQVVGGEEVLVACHKSLLDWYARRAAVHGMW